MPMIDVYARSGTLADSTALGVTPDLPNRWRAGGQPAGRLRPVSWSDKILVSAASMALVGVLGGGDDVEAEVAGADPSDGGW